MNQKLKRGHFQAIEDCFIHISTFNWQSSDKQLQNPLQVCKSTAQFGPCYDNY